MGSTRESMNCTRVGSVCWNLFAVIAIPVLMYAQNNDSTGTQDSCRIFTQEFYDWYLPNTHVKQARMNHMPAFEFALKNRRSSFDPDLVRLSDEGRAQAQRDGEPFLDFDPVLNSQDPSRHYEVKEIAVKDGHCRADVYGEPPGRAGGKPDVVAELTLKGGHWIFADFFYPDSKDPDNRSLLRMLKFLLKKESPPK